MGSSFLTAEPKELTIVLILGPIRMDQLGELKGIGGLGSLGDITKDKDMTKDKDAKDKDQKTRRQGEEGRRPMKRLWLVPLGFDSLAGSGGGGAGRQRRGRV